MRVLVLGGSAFVGRALVQDALDRGADVSVFNRGTRPVPERVTQLTGDRLAGDLDALSGGEWDVVVDTWSATPTAVADTAPTAVRTCRCVRLRLVRFRLPVSVASRIRRRVPGRRGGYGRGAQ